VGLQRPEAEVFVVYEAVVPCEAAFEGRSTESDLVRSRWAGDRKLVHWYRAL
jgi:hypothetical protein